MTEHSLTELITLFENSGFTLLKEQPAMMQKRGLEYVFVHKDLDRLLGIKGSRDNNGYRYYLKKMSDKPGAPYGLNAQHRGSKKLVELSKIVANTEDDFKGNQAWTSSSLVSLLQWIKIKTV